MLKLLVLQSSPFCNIGCKYCYLSVEERCDSRRMSEETLEGSLRFIKESNSIGKKLTILWHAGEPLAVPVNYYKKAVKIIKVALPDTTIRFNFQTNATTLTQEWCDFLKENEVSIGVSIDGPKEIHDAFRVTRSGKGTFDKTIKGIQLLKDNGIPFGTISVITRQSLDYPEEIINFLLDLKAVSIGFNIEENERYHESSDLVNSKGRIKLFVETICNVLSVKDQLSKCREFREIANAVLRAGVIPNSGTTENRLNGILSISWDGKVSTFSPELSGFKTEQYGEFSFGTIHDSYSKYLNDIKLLGITKDINFGIEKCKRTCSYFNLCGGGSPSNKLNENNSFNSTDTIHCYFHNKLFVDQFIRLSKTI